MNKFEFGYAQEDITPKCGLGLCGYFNLRPNRGAYAFRTRTAANLTLRAFLR